MGNHSEGVKVNYMQKKHSSSIINVLVNILSPLREKMTEIFREQSCNYQNTNSQQTTCDIQTEISQLTGNALRTFQNVLARFARS